MTSVDWTLPERWRTSNKFLNNKVFVFIGFEIGYSGIHIEEHILLCATDLLKMIRLTYSLQIYLLITTILLVIVNLLFLFH